MFRQLMAAAAITAGSLALATPASAHQGPPVEVFTDVSKVTNSIPFVNPCTGAFGTANLDFTSVFHITRFEDGHVSVKGQNVGSFDFDPIVGQPASGRFVDRFSDRVTSNTGAFSSSTKVVGKTDTGERIDFTVGFTFKVANGKLILDEVTSSC